MPHQTTAPIVPAADSAHYEPFDPHEPLEPFEAKLDLTEVADTSEPLATRVKNTGELVSPANEVLPGVFDLGAVDAHVPDAVNASLTDTTERFEPLEFSPTGEFARADIAPSYNPGTEDSPMAEMIKDFDTPALGEDSGSEDPTSFGTKPSSSFVVETGRVEGESWFDPDTLEKPGPSKSPTDDAWRVSSNGSALSYQSPDFSLQTETGYHGTEASADTTCATLLAVDEPLGDLLFDDAGLGKVDASEMSSGDLLGLGAIEMQEPLPTHFDLVELGDESPAGLPTGNVSTDAVSPAELSTPEPPEVSQPELLTVEVSTPEVLPVEASIPEISTADGLTTAEENAEVVEPLMAEETPVAYERPEVGAPAPLLDSEPSSRPADNQLDWTTPHAAAYSTAQLDSVVMPIASDEHGQASQAAAQPESTDEASFTAPTMWTEEEARFTPIDIEAVSVEETTTTEVGALENGFEFSAVPPELPISEPADAVVPVTAQQPSNGTPAALTSAAIEEVVRRVIAEMSESVVREVAWEVVPDCVERVIEQLTRESLSKRA
jgi:hypothetical protein